MGPKWGAGHLIVNRMVGENGDQVEASQGPEWHICFSWVQLLEVFPLRTVGKDCWTHESLGVMSYSNQSPGPQVYFSSTLIDTVLRSLTTVACLTRVLQQISAWFSHWRLTNSFEFFPLDQLDEVSATLEPQSPRYPGLGAASVGHNF